MSNDDLQQQSDTGTQQDSPAEQGIDITVGDDIDLADNPVEELPEVTAELIRQLPDEELMKLASLAGEAERNLNAARHAAAELENVRKRMEAQRIREAKYAVGDIVKSMLETLDNLERALASAEQSTDFEPFLEGVKMTLSGFEGNLAKHCVTSISPVGEEFDPEFHDAVMMGRRR